MGGGADSLISRGGVHGWKAKQQPLSWDTCSQKQQKKVIPLSLSSPLHGSQRWPSYSILTMSYWQDYKWTSQRDCCGSRYLFLPSSWTRNTERLADRFLNSLSITGSHMPETCIGSRKTSTLSTGHLHHVLGAITPTGSSTTQNLPHMCWCLCLHCLIY